MFNVQTKIELVSSLPKPYLVYIQIDIDDEEFKQRLIQVGKSKNVRLGCEKKNVLWSALSLDELNVAIIRDDERIENVGYLDEYLENGYVFGFETSNEAEEFEKKAKKALLEYLESSYNQFQALANFDGDIKRQAFDFNKKIVGVYSLIAIIVIVIGFYLLDRISLSNSSVSIETISEKANITYDPVTERLISLSVTPEAQAARYGQSVKATVTITNEGDHVINGVKLSSDGIWHKYDNLSFSNGVSYDTGIFNDQIIINEQIQPKESFSFDITGTVRQGSEVELDGFDYSFKPTMTLDDRTFVGDVEEKSIKIYVLPRSETEDQNEFVSVDEALKELAIYSPAMVDFEFTTETYRASDGDTIKLNVTIHNKGTRTLNGLSMNGSIDWMYLENIKFSPSGNIEESLFSYKLKFPELIKPEESVAYEISGKLDVDVTEVELSLSPIRALDNEEILPTGNDKKSVTIKINE